MKQDKVAIAATFRHWPEEDGPAIPASIKREHPLCWWETIVDPIIGFLAMSYNDRIFWRFIKYEAPEVRRLRLGQQELTIKPAYFSTTKVGHVTCPACGNSCMYPVSGEQEECRCPACGHKGQEISYIHETDDEFSDMLGDLRQPLEDVIRNMDTVTASEFRFPNLLIKGQFTPSASIKPALQKWAAKSGSTLRLATETSFEDLKACKMAGNDIQLFIESGIVSGVLDAELVKNGWKNTEGIVQSYVECDLSVMPLASQSEAEQIYKTIPCYNCGEPHSVGSNAFFQCRKCGAPNLVRDWWSRQ